MGHFKKRYNGRLYHIAWVRHHRFLFRVAATRRNKWAALCSEKDFERMVRLRAIEFVAENTFQQECGQL